MQETVFVLDPYQKVTHNWNAELRQIFEPNTNVNNFKCTSPDCPPFNDKSQTVTASFCQMHSTHMQQTTVILQPYCCASPGNLGMNHLHVLHEAAYR